MSTIVGRRTIRDLLEHRARSDPSREFLVFDDLAGGVLRIDYAGLDRLTNRAADLLTAAGLGAQIGQLIDAYKAADPGGAAYAAAMASLNEKAYGALIVFLTAAYVMNRMSPHLVGDPRSIVLLDAVYAAL